MHIANLLAEDFDPGAAVDPHRFTIVLGGPAIPEASLDRFRAILLAAFGRRNSVATELAMIAVIYGVGIPVVWRHFTTLDVATWYAAPSAEGPRFTPAG